MLEGVSVFSIRHRRALAEGKIELELDDPRLRGRLWRVLEKHNESWSYHPNPSDNWTEETDCFEQVEKALLDTSGESELRLGSAKFSLEFWFKATNASASVLDTIEFFYREIPESNRPAFSADVNRVLGEEDASWRVLEGQFVPLDSVFVHEQLVAASYEALSSVRFAGAAHELLDAQHDLADGDVRGAIHNAGSSFESAMKAALDRDDYLAAKKLIDALQADGYFEGIPEKLRGQFVSEVLAGVPWMRNKLGGHGQGKDKQTVSEPYARLALGLAAVLNEFIVALAVERDASIVRVTDQRTNAGASDLPLDEGDFLPAPAGSGDDDIPF
jgi:AbiJ N-terminal domain 4